MALLAKRLITGFNWIMEDVADPRPAELGLFMMSSPWPAIAIALSYLYFVLNLGPRWMKNRPPYDLKKVILLYNVFQIIANAYIVWEGFVEILFYMDWHCSAVDYSYSPRAIHILRVYHFFFLTKLADLLDTVFFVLRKKDNQLTFLHIYHHFGMFCTLWMGTKFFAGGAGSWLGLINAIVHVFMYTYYALAALDVSWSKTLTVKKFITQIQLVQFALNLFIYGRLMLIDCAYPKIICYYLVIENVAMVFMFSDFYIKAYLKRKDKK